MYNTAMRQLFAITDDYTNNSAPERVASEPRGEPCYAQSTSGDVSLDWNPTKLLKPRSLSEDGTKDHPLLKTSLLAILSFLWMFKTAFLNGDLQVRRSFVSQPEGFEGPGYPTHVYRLRRLLIGLKQHQWACPRGIFINQAKYALETLKKYGMNLSNPVDTPMVDQLKLDEDLGNGYSKRRPKTSKTKHGMEKSKSSQSLKSST
ncbi:retrovirus-related pol polyprotein from transposon TNT 1-94 [Tanacetum coccineum]